MMEPKFLLDRVSYTYEDGVQALRDVNLSIYPDQITPTRSRPSLARPAGENLRYCAS